MMGNEAGQVARWKGKWHLGNVVALSRQLVF
jgi:hypothetical protein